MVSKTVIQEQMAKQEYKYGFVTDVEMETVPKGLNEDVIRLISGKKNEPDWMLDWRLRAYRHWLTMKEPKWSNVRYPPINYQDIIYYAAPSRVPDGTVDLLPNQRARHRSVRTHAHHRGRRCLRQLSRGLHGPDPRHEPAARGGRRADRPRQRGDQVLDDPELVPRR